MSAEMRRAIFALVAQDEGQWIDTEVLLVRDEAGE